MKNFDICGGNTQNVDFNGDESTQKAAQLL